MPRGRAEARDAKIAARKPGITEQSVSRALLALAHGLATGAGRWKIRLPEWLAVCRAILAGEPVAAERFIIGNPGLPAVVGGYRGAGQGVLVLG